MKIIIVSTAYPIRGGIAHFGSLLFQTLRNRGHDVRMISFKRQYPSLFFPGKTQKDLGKESIPIQSEAILDSVGPLSWIRAANRIRQHNPDLVIFNYWMPFFAPCYAMVAFLAKLVCSTKILYVCHNIVPHEPSAIDGVLTRLAFALVDYFLVMSDSVKDELMHFHASADFKRVFHPVYELFGKPIPKQVAKSKLGLSDEKLVLFFGYIRKYKGLVVLLDAMVTVLKEVPARLLVVGEFYDDKSKYVRQIQELKIDEHVTLVDEYVPTENVKLYFSAADVVALPYISATQSGIVQICYNFNKPVIATNVGGLPQVVRNGETGFVVPAGDADAFAVALVRFYRENREQEFSKNVAIVKKNFSWDRIAEAVEKFMA